MQTIEYKNPTVDKSTWGDGPWMNEPDKKQWLDAATGLPCLVVRNTHCTGSLCGYVGLPKSHPLYGKDYYTPDVEVHGGLTFAGECQEVQNDCEGICHKVEVGEDDKVWWFGFDCAHGGDLCPQMTAFKTKHGFDSPMFGIYGFYESYKDFDYVTNQVTNLAAQLATTNPTSKAE